jgi:hypothetical protein
MLGHGVPCLLQVTARWRAGQHHKRNMRLWKWHIPAPGPGVVPFLPSLGSGVQHA